MKIAATYIDKTGPVETEIQNDAEQLVLDINGTRFISRFFDDFEIENKNEIPARFSLNSHNELTACRLVCEMPLTMLHKGEEFQSVLRIDLNLDTPIPTSYQTNAVFSITIENKEIKTSKVQLFEGGLETLKAELPADYKLKCCYGCAFADYSVFGQGFFGTMLCFKNIKEEYLKVKNKGEYMDIMNNHDRQVQETFLCAEFKERETGTGYRG
ncbi:MAG TPA: DUF6304 family protein [Chryseolinea sp.]